MSRVASTVALLTGLAIFQVSVAAADDSGFAAATTAFIDQVSLLSAGECRRDLAARQARYQAVGDIDSGPLLDILQAQKMICAAATLQETRGDLEQNGRSRALSLESGEGDPVTESDGDGLESDSMAAVGVVEAAPLRTSNLFVKPVKSDFGLGKDIETLHRGAALLLLRANNEVGELSPEQADQFLMAIDSEAKHSIFDRFRESLPKQN